MYGNIRRVRRILLLITDLQIGGTPTVVRELAIRLRRPGEVQVEVASLAPWGPVADELQAANVPVIALGATRAIELPRVVREVIRLIRDGQIDTVFSFLMHANAVAALVSRSSPRVRFIQSIQTTQVRPRWHWWLQSLAQHRAEALLVPSPSAARVAQDLADVPAEKIVIIPNAIDPADYSVNSPRNESNFRIGFVGRLDPVKRVTDLVEAAALLDARFHLDIFGEGPERASIERLVSQSNISSRVTLHGVITKPQAAMNSIDVLVLPSEAEGFGLVLIEAMASGVPIVATNVAGIRDIIEHERTGLLAPVGSPSELARAIDRVATAPMLREHLIQNGLKQVRQRYNWDVVIPQYRRLLDL